MTLRALPSSVLGLTGLALAIAIWHVVTASGLVPRAFLSSPNATLDAEIQRLETKSARLDEVRSQLDASKQLEEVERTKQPDLTAADLDAAVRTIAGSARSMGVDVEGA